MVHVRGHLAHDRLGEGTVHGRGADEDRRVHAPHDLGEADAAGGPVSWPVTDLDGGAGVGDLKVAQAGHVVGEQALAVQAPEPCSRGGGA